MTKINKKRVEEFIRVDHAGERGAVKIYEGQLLALNTFVKETNSKIAQKILNDFENELKQFKQICPIEMLDKLDNPISLRSHTKKAG